MLRHKSFEAISGLDGGWLKAKHHFAMGPYGNPAHKPVGNLFVLNDDEIALDLLRDLLQPEGYKVFTAQSAHRALEITSAVRTDIIICDVVMPEMNGMELCRRLYKKQTQ